MAPSPSLSRRKALQSSGAVAVDKLTGCMDILGSQEVDSQADEPDYGEWFADANGYEHTVDRRDDDTITFTVGSDDGFAFDPVAVAVSPGSEITWEWTGDAGEHNVQNHDGPLPLDSENISDGDHTHTALIHDNHLGITRYVCSLHEYRGMKGAVAVADPSTDLSELSYDEPDEDIGTYGGWLDDVEGYSGPVDRTDESNVLIRVGAGGDGNHTGIYFDPVAVQISPDTTIVWGWTGEGGSHNVVAVEGPAEFKSQLVDRWSHEFSVDFTDEHIGVVKYRCEPHSPIGMRGVVEIIDS